MKYSLVIYIASVCFLISCKKEQTEQCTPKNIKKLNSDRPDLNLSILLDLSDRIDPNKNPAASMDYYKRDLSYVESVASAFETHIWNKKIYEMNDQIQLYIEPEPLDPGLNTRLDSLKMEFNKTSATNCTIAKISEKYSIIPDSIYASALKQNDFIGSDIYGFFKSKVNDFCIKEGYRNVLVVLTDGYIYHKNAVLKENGLTSYLTPQTIRGFKLNTSNWEENIEAKNYGFIPANKNLKALEVLVLGINPDPKNPYEEDVILKYWEDWFAKMGIEHYEIKQALLPSDMKGIIQEFIWTNRSI